MNKITSDEYYTEIESCIGHIKDVLFKRDIPYFTTDELVYLSGYVDSVLQMEKEISHNESLILPAFVIEKFKNKFGRINTDSYTNFSI